MCNLNYLLEQGTTVDECKINYKLRWYPYRTVLKIAPNLRSDPDMDYEIDIKNLTKGDIEDYKLQKYKLEYIFENIEESKVQKERRNWTLDNTKGLFRSLREQALIQINNQKEYKISCGKKGCEDCTKWYMKDNWKKLEMRLLRWEKELNPTKTKNKRGRKRKLVDIVQEP